MLGCFVANAGQYLGKVWIREARASGGDDEANRVGALPLQALSDDMRTVTHLPGRLEDPLPRFLGYVVVATQGTGDSGDRNADLLGNVLKGDSHR